MLKVFAVLVFLVGCEGVRQSPPAEVQRESQADPSPTTSRADTPALPKGWKIRITTSGGFAGQGAGNVTISSDGKLSGSSRNGPVPCGTVDLGADRVAVERAVAAAKPEKWTACYDHANRKLQCCDHFRYNLVFTRTEREDQPETYETTWQGSVPYFPDDLKGLFAAAWNLREKANAACK